MTPRVRGHHRFKAAAPSPSPPSRPPHHASRAPHHLDDGELRRTDRRLARYAFRCRACPEPANQAPGQGPSLPRRCAGPVGSGPGGPGPCSRSGRSPDPSARCPNPWGGWSVRHDAAVQGPAGEGRLRQRARPSRRPAVRGPEKERSHLRPGALRMAPRGPCGHGPRRRGRCRWRPASPPEASGKAGRGDGWPVARLCPTRALGNGVPGRLGSNCRREWTYPRGIVWPGDRGQVQAVPAPGGFQPSGLTGGHVSSGFFEACLSPSAVKEITHV